MSAHLRTRDKQGRTAVGLQEARAQGMQPSSPRQAKQARAGGSDWRTQLLHHGDPQVTLAVTSLEGQVQPPTDQELPPPAPDPEGSPSHSCLSAPRKARPEGGGFQPDLMEALQTKYVY